jgi:hypothetical protein
MAKLTSLFSFQGSLDGISVYKMEGVEKPVVRKKGGAAKEKILRDPCFKNTRRTMGEFGGRSAASRYILEAFTPLRPGHGTTGRINKVLTALQKMDTDSPWGRRSVALTLCPQLLQGLDISKRLLLDDILKNALTGVLSRTELKGIVSVPPIIPGVNCLHPKSHPFFRVVAVLGVVPDLIYHEHLLEYGPPEGFLPIPAQSRETPWKQTNSPAEAATLEVTLRGAPAIEGYCLMLSVAIQYGKLGPTGAIEPLPKAVASKIIAVG